MPSMIDIRTVEPSPNPSWLACLLARLYVLRIAISMATSNSTLELELDIHYVGRQAETDVVRT